MPSRPEEREIQERTARQGPGSSPPYPGSHQLPPSRLQGEDDINFNDYVHEDENNNDIDTQNTNATSCVGETQYVDLEIDTQAPEDRFSPPRSQRFDDEANVQLQEVPRAMPQPVVIQTQPGLGDQPMISRFSEPESVAQITEAFRFAPAIRPNGKPQPGNSTENRPAQVAPPAQIASPSVTGNPLPRKEKATNVAQPHLPSRGGNPRSSNNVRMDVQQPLVNAPQLVGDQASREEVTRASATKDRPQKPIQSKANGAGFCQPVAQIAPVKVITGKHAIQQGTSNAKAGATNISPTLQPLSTNVPPSHVPQQQRDAPVKATKVKKSSKPAKLPFPELSREGQRPPVTQDTSVEDRENIDRRAADNGRGLPGMQADQTVTSFLGGNQQQLANLSNYPGQQVRGNGIELPGNQDQIARSDRATWNAQPQDSRRPELVREKDHSNPDSDLPNAQDARRGQVRQRSARPVAGRPMQATQLQPEDAPHRIMDKSRGVSKSSKPRPPKSVTSEVSNRNVPQAAELNTKPTSVDILQMVMFMAQNEQVQSQQAELEIQNQKSKLDQLQKENFALHQQASLLREEKSLLENEFKNLRKKSEQYKSHMNDVTRTQKLLQDTIQKSDARQALLKKDIENRENVAGDQVREAKAQVDKFKSDLATRVDQGVKEARHEIEKLEILRVQLNKDLDGKALELLLERGRCDELQKKIDAQEPNQRVLFQKLQEHFEKVTQQLSGHEGKISTIASAEETAKSKFDECLTILNTIKDKESPEPPDMGELTKMVEKLATKVENRLTSDGETQSNLREAGKELLNDLKDRVEAIQTDQKVQEDLNDRIIILSGANAGLTEKVQTLEGKLTELGNQHSSLIGKYSASKEELSRVLAQPREDPLVQNQLQQLQNTNVSLLSQVDTISKEATSAKENLIMHQNKSKSDQEQAETLRNKLRDAESLISGFSAQKREYELAKTEESIKLRKELEKTLTEKLAEQSLQHENDELGLKRAKIVAERKLSTALADLEKSKASCLTAAGETEQLRAELESAEINKDEQAAEIDRLEENLDSITERYNSNSNELQSARDEISQCRQLVRESEDQAAKSTELIEKTRDEALQGLKNTEQHAETEIGKLKERIVNMQEVVNKSKKLEEQVAKLQEEVIKSKKLEEQISQMQEGVGRSKKLEEQIAKLQEGVRKSKKLEEQVSQMQGDVDKSKKLEEQIAKMQGDVEKSKKLEEQISRMQGDVDKSKSLEEQIVKMQEEMNKSKKLEEQITKMQGEAGKAKILEEQVAKMQEAAAKSKKFEEAVGRFLKSREVVKEGQDLHQWASGQEDESAETRTEEPTPRSGLRVTFQAAPSVQTPNQSIVQSAASKNAPQTQGQSSRTGRPRIADRRASNQNQSIVNPSHMSGLDNMLMQRTEVTEYSVRTSKTYESHRNTPNRASSSAPESQTMAKNSAMKSNHQSSMSSPMTDLEPLFSDYMVPETGRSMGKALKRQRSMKPPQKSLEDDRTIIPGTLKGADKAGESARRREPPPPRSALKRTRSTNTPQNSEAPSSSQGDDVVTPSSRQGQARALADMLIGKSTNVPSSSRQLQRGSPYNRIVEGNSVPTQQQKSAGTSHKNSSFSRQLSVPQNSEGNLGSMGRRGTTGMVTRSAGNGDDHPAKLQRLSQPAARKPAKSTRTVIPDSQGDSQFSAYEPSQNA